jgi:isochorismate synthase
MATSTHAPGHLSDIGADSPLGRLDARIAEAARRARARQRPVIVSVVERLRGVDPLAVIASFARAGDRDVGGDSSAMYWARPADRFAMAGIGTAATLTARGPDRFRQIERAWTELAEDALRDEPTSPTGGVGPTLMGGFAFDPDGPRTARWDGFPSAHFTLPRFLVAEVGDAHWLTTTIIVEPTGEADIALADLAPIRAAIMDSPGRSDGSRPAARDARVRYSDLGSPDEWRASVRLAVDTIRGGALEKVVLARGVQARGSEPFDTAAAVRHLGTVHPDSFIFACWRDDRVFLGASPERLVRVDGREVLASSLAGSARRGTDAAEDAELAAGLLESSKDADEHAVVVRALRDTLAQLCDDVTAAATPSVLTLPHMHHLHTIVRAHLRDGHSLLELVGRLHPTPAVGGTPRDTALAFIRAHEQLDRGWYAAPVGWLQCHRGEFAVALRSALVQGSDATLFAGCGIVRDSDPDLEYAESVLKLRPMAATLAAAQGIREPLGATLDAGPA